VPADLQGRLYIHLLYRYISESAPEHKKTLRGYLHVFRQLSVGRCDNCSTRTLV